MVGTFRLGSRIMPLTFPADPALWEIEQMKSRIIPSKTLANFSYRSLVGLT